MNEIVLAESQSLRCSLCTDNNTSILDNVGTLVTLNGTDFVTTINVAKFYQVPKNTIEYTVKRHYEEFASDGYKVFKKKDLQNWHCASFKIPNRGLALFTKRAVLRCGCILRDSIVAKNVRTYLLNVHDSAAQSNVLSQIAQQLNENALCLAKHTQELVDHSRFVVAIVTEVNKNQQQIRFLHDQVKTNYNEIQNLKKCLSPEKCITTNQIEILKAEVKKKGHPNQIWKRLNKYLGVSSYKNIPRSQFNKALRWVKSF